MPLLFFEHFRTAHESLKRTRARTLLTISGVAIGVASITTILALGSGITQIVDQQVIKLGKQIAIVRPSPKTGSLIELGNPTPVSSYTTSPLQERDVEDLAAIKGVESVTPLMTISGSLRSKDERVSNGTVLATTPSFIDTSQLSYKDGQFIDDVTLEDTAVLGSQLALDLFGTDDAVGKGFFIRGQRFTVIGVINRQSQPINYNNVDIDHAAIISLDSGKLFNNGVAQIQQLNIKTKSGSDANAVKKAIDRRLIQNHDGERDTVTYVGSEIAEPTNRLFFLISAGMAIIAGISLLVGGIGIMNIMLVGVAERTREIGLRKSVGASSGSIVLQFLIESIILGIIGGVLGYLGGYVIAFLISLLLPYDPVINWQIAAAAAGLSLGVGTLFGVYPAIKAARKNPIESLRRMH